MSYWPENANERMTDRRNQLETGMANRRQLYKYKGDRCSYCHLPVEEMVERYGTVDRMFEFNHVDPAQKSRDYENLIRRVISSENLDEVDKCVLVCRQCHGIGMTIEEQHGCSLLVPGRRNKEKQFSTGYGLPIAARNVAAHGGSLTLESREDQGTTVMITLPLSEEE